MSDSRQNKNTAVEREPHSLPIAIRVYPEGEDFEPNDRPRITPSRPTAMFVFDTESRVDATQRLTFGSYRFIASGEWQEEGLFYGDDLPDKDRKVIEAYFATHMADRADGVRRFLLTRGRFRERLFGAVYKGRCLLVAFNFPFDISRVAFKATNARDRFAGGFSLQLWSYVDSDGVERSAPHRPSIAIKQIDSKRALKAFRGRLEPDTEDLIREGSRSGKPEKHYVFHGHFLDLRTLAFALTDRGYTLEGACEDFGVEHPKRSAERHGEVTEEYIHYNRRDVLATSELAVKLLEEYDRHPISDKNPVMHSLQVTKAYSPASIGKAYLRQMGIKPVLRRQRNFPKRYLGYAQSAFFGGRTSAHIRKVVVPVVYTDFLSMYPTVNALMNLWTFVIARRITVIEHCKTEIEGFLKGLKRDDLFNPATWKQLPAFVRVVPNGDILPSRARYSVDSNDWQVAVNHLYGKTDRAEDALWFSLPDVVASQVLTGHVPNIVDAFRIQPSGPLLGLQPIKLRGAVEVHPAAKDFFKEVIEQRKRLSGRSDLPESERKRLDKALKVLANATSYGIYAEMNRQESEQTVRMRCHGIDADPFPCRVKHPDVPGEFCFPPLASLITGAARLMLSLLEYTVTELGGTYAMEDTDSMAIVATEHGGPIPIAEGQEVKALSWDQVRKISAQFSALNPYNREAIPESVLKLEDDNFDPQTKKQRQLYCLAISAKRYALFLRDEKGNPVLLRASCPFCGHKNKGKATICGNKDCRKPIHVNNDEDRWSEHGLGHLLNPANPEDEDREWIAQAWDNLVHKSLGEPKKRFPFAVVPAVGRVTVSSPAVRRPLAKLNEGKRYADQIKPFSFLLTCHVKPLGHPIGIPDPEHFHLIAPYESDSRKWLKNEWIDQYDESGKSWHITTEGFHGTRAAARVKTYGDVLTEYEFHAESKCADVNGDVSGKSTIGLLQRRHVRIDQIKYIGKESNSLEEVEAGLIHSPENIYTEYVDPRRDDWETKIRPILQRPGILKLIQGETSLSRRMLIDARTGKRRPHPTNQRLISEALKKLDLT